MPSCRIIGLSDKWTLNLVYGVDDVRLPHMRSVYTPAFGFNETKEQMKSDKDRLAQEVMDRWVSFQMALSNKRKYPAAELTAFTRNVRE